MEVIVRHVEDKDIEAIKNLYAGKNAYSGTLQLPFPSLRMWEKRLSDLPDNVYSLLAEKGGEVVGQVGMEVLTRPRRKHVAQFGMAVNDNYLGLGVGSKLLSTIIDLAENWLNVSRIELTVYTDNAPAIALYEKHGFVIEGEARDYAFRNGEHVNVYHMARVKS
ncbi:GNAT family N-acetyltransferase [Photobacterium sp. SDRW27]|uniref:GNAT family N-acetyltransferase n=1 Tax=Photobacterium obscurum TaxID=2829490 RepID=UPI002244B854|nr:GNAT family N-acetyltransferase [Photobacterium obscurum]MCW8328519.1 GNAT family N-acetyltransferase [Photobacterium obscurum]